MEDEEKCLNNNYSNDKKVLHAEYLKDKEELTRIANSQIGSYEGFAIWLESYLSERTDNNALFEKKMAKEISPSYSSVFNDFKSFEKRYGAFAIVAQLGFPKYYDQSKIVAVLKNFLEKEFDSIELCILYGSKKPYSDIDIFIVSDSVKSFSNHWLDIYSLSRSEFDEKIKNFSIDALDPVFSGEVLKGDNIEQIKQRVLSMPVTEDTISYNLKKSEEQGQIAGMYHEDSKERRIALSYQRSYYENAKNLKEGKKILTLKSIESQ
ncbi:hypothetical protein COT07_04935 [Candidatus Woesearchaeota archaeon CG07_land_8_20_14_0_80_44_23]|nr:MAG: hypothetical protein COT07_04935 [Candidatus Woesearchaeota archaeon CG07_land_8_20_14_0_80_44_23]